MNMKATLGAAALVIGSALAGTAATLDAYLYETGTGDVVLEYSGAIDLTGATFVGTDARATYTVVDPSRALFILYNGSASAASAYDFAPNGGVRNFGTGGEVFTTTGTESGDSFAFLQNGPSARIGVPTGYSSGDALSGRSTITGTDIATLGATTGFYSWTAGNNTISLSVGSGPAPVVPLPATGWMLLGSFAGLMALRRRKMRARAPV